MQKDPILAAHLWRKRNKRAARSICGRCGGGYIVADLRQTHPVFTLTWCPDCRSRETVRQAGDVPAIARELLEHIL